MEVNVQTAVNEDGSVDVSSVGVGVRTVPDLLALAEISLDDWTVEWSKINKWDMPVAGGKIAAMWQVKVTLRPKLHAVAREVILEEIAKEATLLPAEPPPTPARDDGNERYLLEIGITDLHLGLRAWAAEAGEDYNIEKAAATYLWAVAELLHRARNYPIEKVVLVLGSDFFHVDNLHGTTTGGTPQDVAGTYREMFRVGWQTMLHAIALARKVAPVELMLVPGNHDRLTSWHLAELLHARFHADPSVTVDSSPEEYKYIRYGRNLIGWTHGYKVRSKDLPLLMARQRPQDWADTVFREWHLGDRHHMIEEQQGVVLRWLSALSPASEWIARTGYHGLRVGWAFLWESERGLAAMFPATVDPRGVVMVADGESNNG